MRRSPLLYSAIISTSLPKVPAFMSLMFSVPRRPASFHPVGGRSRVRAIEELVLVVDAEANEKLVLVVVM